MSNAVKMGAVVFGVLLQERIRKKIGQSRVATYMGVSVWQFSRFENASAQPSFDELFRWADILDIEITAKPRKSEDEI
ncbi:MAG: helix-turn-helix transcriptional regulator [Clostridiaceae bacterium]|nr:helix-turn-helix transcriptional regulator [Clostridiaceae bacterium]